ECEDGGTKSGKVMLLLQLGQLPVLPAHLMRALSTFLQFGQVKRKICSGASASDMGRSSDEGVIIRLSSRRGWHNECEFDVLSGGSGRGVAKDAEGGLRGEKMEPG